MIDGDLGMADLNLLLGRRAVSTAWLDLLARRRADRRGAGARRMAYDLLPAAMNGSLELATHRPGGPGPRDARWSSELARALRYRHP
jgi:hypothetical protein